MPGSNLGARRSGDHGAIASAIEGLAGAAVLRGDGSRATDLLAAAVHIRDSASRPATPLDDFELVRIKNMLSELLEQDADIAIAAAVSSGMLHQLLNV